jgi:hypothetical protein
MINLIHNGKKQGRKTKDQEASLGDIQKILKGFILEGHLDISEIKMRGCSSEEKPRLDTHLYEYG